MDTEFAYTCGPATGFDIYGNGSVLADEMKFKCEGSIGSANDIDWNDATNLVECKCIRCICTYMFERSFLICVSF